MQEQLYYKSHQLLYYHIGGVMVSVLIPIVVDRELDPWSGQTKDYKNGICCLYAKLAALRKKSKECLAWNQDNMSERGDMSTCRLLFQWASTINIQLSVLVQYKADLIIIISLKIDLLSPWYSWKIDLLSPWYSWKIAELALNNNHSHNY